jgi:hypothetical protein
MKIHSIDLGDSTVISVSPLTMEQVERIIDAPPTDNQKELRERTWATIWAAIQNTGKAVPWNHRIPLDANDPRLTLYDLKAAITMPQYMQLHRAVLEISGLRVASPGESAAAAETSSTLQSSEAA